MTWPRWGMSPWDREPFWGPPIRVEDVMVHLLDRDDPDRRQEVLAQRLILERSQLVMHVTATCLDLDTHGFLESTLLVSVQGYMATPNRGARVREMCWNYSRRSPSQGEVRLLLATDDVEAARGVLQRLHDAGHGPEKARLVTGEVEYLYDNPAGGTDGRVEAFVRTATGVVRLDLDRDLYDQHAKRGLALFVDARVTFTIKGREVPKVTGWKAARE